MLALKVGCSFNKSRGCVVKQIIFAKYQQECLLKVVFIIVAKHVRLCRERELTKQFKMVLETSLISGQSYKQFTIVNYGSSVVIWANL